MIYFPDKKIVIITPPHTASRNTHLELCLEKHGGYWVLGDDPFSHGNVNHHTCRIPKGWPNPKVYVICRDPYTRLVGLFLHYEWAQDKGLMKDYLCWEEFVYDRDKLALWHLYTKTIAEWAGLLEDYESIKYENIEEELSTILEAEVSLPPGYHDLIKLEEWYYDPKLLKHVNETWASEDCKMFNYPIIT
jgi:hypothetical protein